MPIGSYTNAINKVCISRQCSSKGFRSRCFLSGLGLAIALECSSNQCFWPAFLYIFTIEMICYISIVSRSRYSVSFYGILFLIFRTPCSSTTHPLSIQTSPIPILTTTCVRYTPINSPPIASPSKRTSHPPKLPEHHIP